MNIFVLPSSNKNNAYINLFVDSLKVQGGVRVIGLKNDDPFYIFSYWRKGELAGTQNILHVHWPTVLYGSRFVARSLFRIAKNALLLAILKTFLNVKIVWTLHNFHAHDYPHRWIDVLGQKMIRSFADLIIVQQKKTLADYKKKYPKKNTQFIPHANYIDVYGPLLNRDNNLRTSLGFSDQDIVLISLGVIAPYKVNEKIIDAIKNAGAPNVKLLICGKGKEEYLNQLEKYAGKHPSVVIKSGFIADTDISKYLSIADYSVFYYDDSEMTSGGVILSLSYGIPAIVRNIPAAEIISAQNGHIFADENALSAIIKSISELPAQRPSPEGQRAIIETVRQDSWVSGANTLLRLYKALS